jgi:hypothetical protein
MLVPDEAETHLDGHTRLWSAIKTIIVADFIMSLDNVLGVAAAAKGHLVLLVLGLAISIPLIIYGSTLILKLMNRFPFIITLGGGILGWVAGEMAVTDPAINSWVDGELHWLHEVSPVAGAAIVVVMGKLIAALEAPVIAETVPVERAEEVAAEPAPPGYRWMHRAWRMLPDGTRDYAAYYGKTAFRFLMPVSSRLRSPRSKTHRNA